MWLRVGSLWGQADLERLAQRWQCSCLGAGGADGSTATSSPCAVPVRQGPFVPPSAGTGYPQQVKGSWWPQASQPLGSFPGQRGGVS